MKKQYVLYIDYRVKHIPAYEYLEMDAENLLEAIVEADKIHNADTMYLVRLMEKSGRVEKVERDVKAQTYKAIIEKRSTKWDTMETSHSVKRYISKHGEWFAIV